MFLKIYVYDQKYIKGLRKLLENKVIMDISFRCYEAHLSYFINFYSDMNIYGLYPVKFIRFKFRKNLQYDEMKLFAKNIFFSTTK